MEHHDDSALTFSNPRLLSAIYFGLLSVVGTVLINAFLTTIGIKEAVPLFHAIVLGMVISSAMGALYGKAIIYCPAPYIKKVFFMGFIMVIASLPLFALGIIYLLYQENSSFILQNARDLTYNYLVVLAYCYILFGIWLAIASGMAAIYLRARLVYDILHTDPRRSMRLPRYVSAHRRTASHKDENPS